MKKFIVTLIAIAMMTGSAMATESRVHALGYYAAPYIEDDYNIFSWYATLPSYSNLMVIGLWNDWEYDYGDDVMGYFGLTYGLGEDASMGVIGFFLSEEMWGPNMFGGDVYGFYNWDAPTRPISWWDIDRFGHSLMNKYSLMYGYGMEGMSFGLYFSRSSEGYTEEQPDDTYENRDAYTTFGVGARMDIGEDMVADVAFDMTMASYTDGWEDDQITEDANKALNFRGRLFYNWSEEITFVPYLAFNMGDFSLTNEDDDYYPDAGGLKYSMFKFGIGTNLNVNEDNLIVFGVETSFFSSEPSTYADDEEFTLEVKSRTLPRFILALESDLTEWMTFRIGAHKSIAKFTYEITDPADDTVTWESDWDYYDYWGWNLGLGFHWGDFDVDCVLNKDVPFSMGYWLTGFQDNYDNEATPIFMISALYHY